MTSTADEKASATKDERTAIIQTTRPLGFTPPAPFRVNVVGAITGRPSTSASPDHLVGFTSRMDRFDVDLELSEFFDDPERAVGMYPVTSDDHGYLATHLLSVEWVVPEGQPEPQSA